MHLALRSLLHILSVGSGQLCQHIVYRTVLTKIKIYSFANFRSTPDIFTLSFVNHCFERSLLISLVVAMVTLTKMVMLIYLTFKHNLKLVPRALGY